MSRFIEIPCGYLGFHRLAIMGLDERGMQPFQLDDDYVVCNGELYGFRPIRARLMEKYDIRSESDCEILLPLYREYGLEMFRTLDAEFALILYDAAKNSLIAARDPIGIRPLYYGLLADGGMAFASEPKNLVGLCETILPFPPGHYWADGEFVCYADPAHVEQYVMEDEATVCARLHAAPTDRMFLCWVWTWKCYSAGCSYGIHTNARSLGCRCSSLLLFRIVFDIKFACILARRNPYVKKEIASKCANLQDDK